MIGGVSSSSWELQHMQRMQQAGPKEGFEKADVNGDNAIDMDEFLAKHEGLEKSEDLFAKIDTDGDGGLTESEMKAFGDEMRDNMQMMMSNAMGKMPEMRGMGGGGRPEGKGGPGGPQGMGGQQQGSINGAMIQQMLAAYGTDETEETTEVTEADLLEEYFEILEAAEEESTESTADPVSASLELLI